MVDFLIDAHCLSLTHRHSPLTTAKGHMFFEILGVLSAFDSCGWDSVQLADSLFRGLGWIPASEPKSFLYRICNESNAGQLKAIRILTSKISGFCEFFPLI